MSDSGSKKSFRFIQVFLSLIQQALGLNIQGIFKYYYTVPRVKILILNSLAEKYLPYAKPGHEIGSGFRIFTFYTCLYMMKRVPRYQLTIFSFHAVSLNAQQSKFPSFLQCCLFIDQFPLQQVYRTVPYVLYPYVRYRCFHGIAVPSSTKLFCFFCQPSL